MGTGGESCKRLRQDRKAQGQRGMDGASGSAEKPGVTGQALGRRDPVKSSALATKNRNAPSPEPEQQKGAKEGNFTP